MNKFVFFGFDNIPDFVGYIVNNFMVKLDLYQEFKNFGPIYTII